MCTTVKQAVVAAK